MPLDRIPGSMLSLLTPSQFDASFQPATTEFVQRALGNLSDTASGNGGITTSRTLGAADAGKLYSIEANGLTITIPAPNTLPGGTTFYIQKRFEANASGSIVVTGGGTFSYTQQTSTLYMIVNRGAGWSVFTSGVGDSLSASLATSGYQKLPSGLIVQWGVTASIATEASLTFSLPIAFPTAHVLGVATPKKSAAGTGSLSAHYDVVSLSQAVISNETNGGGSASQFQYIAIGY